MRMLLCSQAQNVSFPYGTFLYVNFQKNDGG